MSTMKARYEFKYLITEEQQDFIRTLASFFLEPDPYGQGSAYMVNSLYLDTWEWDLAMMTVEGLKNRFKLRARCYDFEGASPVFLENKGRVGTSIVKSRAKIDRAQATDILLGNLPPESGYTAIDSKSQDQVTQFRDRMDFLDLRPTLWVRYLREAWVSCVGDGSRLTFDYALQFQHPIEGSPMNPEPTQWVDVDLVPNIILEMKFNGASPKWMANIVNMLGLKRISCSKYGHGARMMAPEPWAVGDRECLWMPT